MVESGAELLDAKAAVLLLSDAANKMHVRAAHGIASVLLTESDQPVAPDALVEHLCALFGATHDDFAAVPLIVGGTVTGILAVATMRATNAADEWLLSALADQASVALEHARVGGEVRGEMETRLRASEGSATAKDRALSTLAHDIRTPLGAIDAYCAILEDEMFGPVNERQCETLGRIRMSGRHLLSLLDNVMEMARIHAGAVHMHPVPFRMIDTARDAVQMLAPSAETKSIVLTLNADVPGNVVADEARVRQVLINLIGNAVKFTPDHGNVAITIRSVKHDANDCIEVRVRDSGPGIRADEQRAIFEPNLVRVKSRRSATSCVIRRALLAIPVSSVV